jgi:hypothetical protein
MSIGRQDAAYVIDLTESDDEITSSNSILTIYKNAADQIRKGNSLNADAIGIFCKHVLGELKRVSYIGSYITDVGNNNWNGNFLLAALDTIGQKKTFRDAMKKFNTKEVDMLVIPFHNPMHWLLILVVRSEDKPVTYVVNSLPESNKDVYSVVANFISRSVTEREGFTMATTHNQNDSTSCGLFTMLYVEAASECMKHGSVINANSFQHITQSFVENRRTAVADIVESCYYS